MQQRKGKKILIYFFLLLLVGSINNINLNTLELPNINNINIGKIIKKLKKYLKYKLLFTSEDKIEAIIIIVKGFKTSIGWNRGKNTKSIHLLDPLTSIPINGTSNKAVKQTIKRIFEAKNKLFVLM